MGKKKNPSNIRPANAPSNVNPQKPTTLIVSGKIEKKELPRPTATETREG